MNFTETQLRALRWMDEFPSTAAAWTVDGAEIKRQKPDKWNMMRLSGVQGSILIHKDDLAAIRGLYVLYASPNKMYSLNDMGRAALKTGVDA